MTLNIPGVRVTENTYGAIPAILNTHDTVYVFGSATTGNENILTYVSDYTDFTNVYGSSPSAAAVQLFFNQRSGSGLYFCRVAKKAERTLTVGTFTPGTVLTLTVNSVTVSYTCVAGDTATTARAVLGNTINTQMPGLISYYDTGIIRYTQGATITGSAGLTLGAEVVPTGSFKPADVADAMQTALQPEMSQGFICAPEFFQSFTTLSDRTFLQQQMEAIAASPDYNHVAVIDCGSAAASATTGGQFISLVLAERNTFISPRGHSWYVVPYVKNATDTLVPGSLVQIGVALRKYRNESYAQPPAGITYPVYGVKDVSFPITDTIQSQLNPVGINCIRNLSRGRGVVVYGARTLSTSSYYRFGNTRVILNVLASSLKAAYDQLIFSLVDGQGLLFSRIKQTAAAFCEVLRLNGALFGASPDEAYLVICDTTNNNPNDLEAGVVNVDLVVKPSPTMEVLMVNISRASLGTVLAEITNTGQTEPTGDISTPQP